VNPTTHQTSRAHIKRHRVARSPNPFAARQALLVDLMLLLFAVLYFAKVSSQIGVVILVAVLLVRWRRAVAGCGWLYQRFYIPCSMLALALEYPGHTARSENFYWWLAMIFLPTLPAPLLVAFAIWRCPACGCNPGSHPWGAAVHKCEKCGARLKYGR
jgi:hypothetical protein